MRVLMLINCNVSLFNFRNEIVDMILAHGSELIVSVPSGRYDSYYKDKNCILINSPIDRRGVNPIKDLKLTFHYRNLIKTHKPDIILTFTAKPNIYGNIAANLCGVRTISNITGLGFGFEKKFISNIMHFLYRFGVKKAGHLFLQNQGDLNKLEKKHLLPKSYSIIPGSGVNLNIFKYKEYKRTNSVKFLFMSRVVKEKGIEEYLYTAKKMKEKYHQDIEFLIAGFFDEEKYKSIVEEFVRIGVVKYCGYVENKIDLYASIDCIVVPSYSEGMSNVLLEAGATGRATLASDINGCKEIIIDKKSGYVFNVKDKDDCLKKVEDFYNLSFEEKVQMGKYAHEHIKDKYDRSIVVKRYENKIYGGAK